MTDHRANFLKAIAESPFDETTRLIFADWLDENGEHEEAERQRKFVPALRVLERYADTDWESRQPGYKEKLIAEYGEEEWNESYANTLDEPYTFEALMASIEWWKEGVLGKSKYGDYKPWIGFGSNFAQDELHDKEKRREFWEAFEVVTGIQAPADLKKQDFYHCAC